METTDASTSSAVATGSATTAIDSALLNTPAPTDSIAGKIYRIGSLRYTIGGLAVLFTWLLLADFAFSLMELVIPKILPLTLTEVGASNATIGLIVGTVASLMNLVLNPIISFHSDRHRGRWGRRKPYLMWSAPFISLFLIITGYSADLGHWIHSILSGRFGHLSQASVILATIAVAAVVFQFFNMFVRSVYYYLLNDVVPVSIIGRFYALFRVVDASAGFVFNGYILRYADHPLTRKWIYIGMGLIYLAAFALMCWRVREGQYPPPEPLGDGTWLQRVWAAIRTYATECFSVPLFWWLYAGNALYRASEVSIFNFQLLLAKDVGMDLAHSGSMLKWVSLAGVVLYWPLGWLADKIHAVRLAILSAAMTLIVMMLSMFFVRGPTSFSILTFLWQVAWLAYISAVVPLTLYLLPRDRYGQFSSANAMFYAVALMVANYGGGLFIDKAGISPIIRRGISPYLAIFWWGAVCTLLSLICLIMVYRGWKRHGGPYHYVPPGS